MIVDPAIAALRSNPASQRWLRAQMDAIHAGWRHRPEVARILHDLARFSEGQALDQLSALADVMTSLNHARDLINVWLGDFVACLSTHCLAQLPMQHHHSDGLTTMQLASAGQAALSLSVYAERQAYSAAESAVFADREMHDLILDGRGEARLHQLCSNGEKAAIETRQLILSAGSRLASVGKDQARQFDRVSGQLLVLQLSRIPTSPDVTCEHSLETGQLLRQSSGDKRASQQEMAMAVLSAMGRSDAAPILADMTKTGPDHLRWEAMRHALALDTGAGLRALIEIASSTDECLAGPADRLLAHLQVNYPQLAQRQAA